MITRIILLLLLAFPAFAATIAVPGDHATIQAAVNAASANDTIIVQTNTYNERVALGANPLTIIGVNTPTVRGFDLTSRSNNRIIGFEITQLNAQNYPAFQLSGSHLNQIINNNIHHTYGDSSYGVRMAFASPCHSNQIFGNTISWIKTNAPGGEIALIVFGNYNLVEYNHITRVGDFMNVWGSNNIVRNNFWGHCHTNDFPGTAHHIDGIQWFPDDQSALWRTMMDANKMRSNYIADAHFFIIQNTSNDESRHFTARRNVISYHGSEALASNPFYGVYQYNNTIVDSALLTPANYAASADERDGFYTTNWHMLNNIFARACRDTASGGIVYFIDPGGSGNWGNYNLRYQSGTPTVNEPNDIEANPDFVDDPEGSADPGDLQIIEGSPARNVAGALTTANGGGMATATLVVNSNIYYFCDGFGIADGDWIVIGSGDPVQISSIDDGTSTITLSENRSWVDGNSVWLATPSEKMDDIGAYEYRATGHTLSATYSVSGTTYTAVPSDVNICRMVVFFQDGIPHTRDYSSPYTATIASGTVTVRAYPRFAAETLWANATQTFGGAQPHYRNKGRSLRGGGVGVAP